MMIVKKKKKEIGFYGFISLSPANARHNRPKEFWDKQNISFDELKKGICQKYKPAKI